uniref:Uncharacterized protein n=1 Tax=Amphimedon queenslandica TaxID=400682 RepID=A0A1X7UNG4_AMPQE
MCKQAKESMKQKNDSELGSFKNAVTCGDAAWLTRGYRSQNATYTLRNYQISGFLYYKYFSQRGKDDIREELFEVKCHCMKDDFGCFTKGFIKTARISFSAIVESVGCHQDAFSDQLHSQAKYHAKNVHKYEGGKCFFYDLTVCDCGKYTKGDITCQGKPNKTKNVLSCPFHSLAYEIACEAVIAKSKQIIHEELGCCHTSIIESSQCIAAV